MAKYIDREALVEWLKRIPLKDLSDGLGLCRVIMEDDLKRAIKEMPEGIIADAVQMRHGQWRYYHKQNIAVCTECSFERDLDTNFGRAVNCPNCGAKMDGGDSDG